MIVTDYYTWPAKLFWVRNRFGRQATNYFDIPQQIYFSTIKTELQNSLLRNINDNSDNSEKTKY